MITVVQRLTVHGVCVLCCEEGSRGWRAQWDRPHEGKGACGGPGVGRRGEGEDAYMREHHEGM